MINRPLILSLCWFFMACNAYGAGPERSTACIQDTPLIFGVLPMLSSEKLVQRFAPLVNYLSDELHTPVRIETAPDFQEFFHRTNKEERYDLLFTAPHFFYQARHKAGYRLLARVGPSGMSAIIVVPVRSDIRSVRDLAGRKLATVDPMGLATLLARKLLTESGLDPDKDLTLVSTPSHNASLLSSYYGVTDASSLMMPPFRVASAEVRENMRVVATTESTPHMPVSAAPWVSENCMRDITEVLVRMDTTPEGRNTLGKINFSGFVETDPDVYERLEWAADLLERE